MGIPSSPSGPSPSFEVLEHTADIGLRARGRTLEELFENACRGTLEILGATGEAATEEEVVRVQAADLGALLVDLLNEVIYLVDARRARVARVEVERASPDGVVARIGWAPGPPDLPGTELKAATYHQLAVEHAPDGYEATVYFDV